MTDGGVKKGRARPKSGPRRFMVKYRHFSPFAALLLLGLYAALPFILGPGSVDDLTTALRCVREAASHEIFLSAYGRKSEWGLVTGLFLAACLWMAILCWRTLRKLPGAARRKNCLLTALWYVVPAVAYGSLAYLRLTDFDSPQEVGRSDIWTQFMSLTVHHNGHTWAPRLHLLFDAVGVGAVAVMAFTVSRLMLRRPVGRPRLEAKRQAAAQAMLRAILYSGAALLIIATLRLGAIWQWALAYLKPHAADDIAASVMNTLGAFYSLLLVVIYVPAAVLLRRRLREAERKLDDEAPPRSEPLSEQLLRVAAIFGPLLSGSLGGVLEHLK